MRVIDLRGQKCMNHILKLENEFRDAGKVFVAITDDESAIYDIPVWASSKGIEILEIKREGGLLRFLMRK
ncbi:sulfurtransferase TusA family protein [Geoglobus acetivorans]|uniref:Sulfurtransferase TusA family protein n=1 Tax=Geoglobus acetivorans TaxID=565033 RepID=A0ABZ3H4G3_GEOAI|nr:sulfurtransferase TusA family protein [Geoglobus acetivorans]